MENNFMTCKEENAEKWQNIIEKKTFHRTEELRERLLLLRNEYFVFCDTCYCFKKLQ